MKLFQCTHCLSIGFLILHGFLYGYITAQDSAAMQIKGHRIFCSNRYNKQGCGKTFSILLSSVIKRISLCASLLWEFLKYLFSNVSLQKITDTFNNGKNIYSLASFYRLRRKIVHNQHFIRTKLNQICESPQETGKWSVLQQTIAHLTDAFSEHTCPVSAFQYHFQTSFI